MTTSFDALAHDEMVTPLRDALGDDGLVELTMMMAIENERSRFNAALVIIGNRISQVLIMMNPDKLGGLGEPRVITR